MRLILIILLTAVSSKLIAQAASKDSIAAWMAPANSATIAINNAYKNAFTQINNQIGISSKRADSLRLVYDRIYAAKNKTQDSLISILIKQHRADSLAIEAVKKIASQYSVLTAIKDELVITQTTPGKYTIGFSAKFKSKMAVWDSKLTSGGAADKTKTITIQIK